MMFHELALFLTPLLLTGLVHHLVVVRCGCFAALATPIDAGASWRGKRIFGENKTWRGLMFYVLGTTTTFTLLHHVIPLPLRTTPWIAGLLLGAGYAFGELPNSFLKRRLGIEPGERPTGRWTNVFGILDHVDSVLGALLATCVVYDVSHALVLALFLSGACLHVIVDAYLHRSGYKKDRALKAAATPIPTALPRKE